MSRSSCLAFTVGGLALAGLAAGGVVLVNSDWLARKAGAAWDITYEATAGQTGTPRATDVHYGHNPDRSDSAYKKETTGPVSLPWKKTVFVRVGEQARVEVLPAGNAKAECRILLDGVRVVAEGTSPGPGRPAVCEVATSGTPGKWPR
ncbi:hypothetical protein ACFRAR_05380 [Kitasatospora sp. NPDC056651]|uniref:hypothetical protein n=1 Tax=Kitasatospora sp. NPDC056651 TaxID=3345892 RepID=UPI0036CD9A19